MSTTSQPPPQPLLLLPRTSPGAMSDLDTAKSRASVMLPAADWRRYLRWVESKREDLAPGPPNPGPPNPGPPNPGPSSAGAQTIYPFTKGQELINDGVGFGEIVSELRVQFLEDRDCAVTLQFRRTRSGKVRSFPGDEPAWLNALKGRDQ